jgi:hypothetical protein
VLTLEHLILGAIRKPDRLAVHAPWRAVLIAAVAIPTSIIATFTSCAVAIFA